MIFFWQAWRMNCYYQKGFKQEIWLVQAINRFVWKLLNPIVYKWRRLCCLTVILVFVVLPVWPGAIYLIILIKRHWTKLHVTNTKYIQNKCNEYCYATFNSLPTNDIPFIFLFFLLRNCHISGILCIRFNKLQKLRYHITSKHRIHFS